MNFIQAKQHYREQVTDNYVEPAQAKSRQVGSLWRLRDRHGRTIAIIGSDGTLLARPLWLP